MFARTRDLDARGSAAVVAGLLDVIEDLVPKVQDLLIREATRWPDQKVRRLGLALVVDREGREVAYALAKDDPNARIGAWADSLANSVQVRDGAAGAEGVTAAATRRAAEPQTLF